MMATSSLGLIASPRSRTHCPQNFGAGRVPAAAAHVKRALPCSDAKLLRQSGPSWRDPERGRRLNAGGKQTRANARSQGGATERAGGGV